AYAGGALVVGVVAWAVVWVLLQVALVTFALIVALLLAALLDPLARLLHRRLPAWAAALLSVLLLVGVVLGTGYLLTRRVTGQLGNLVSSLTASIDQIRNWLVNGPLGLAPQTVDQVANQIVGALQSAAPNGFAAAATLIAVLGGVVIALFVLFFLLKDGTGMWRWLVGTAPARYRERVDEAGRRAWDTASRYMVGLVLIALIDAVLIGAALFALGVPLAMSLTVLIFFGAFVPFLGAFVSGLVAALVTLVSKGLIAALIVVGVTVVVQNLEGNVLAPLIQGHQLRLHPVVILVVVTAGYLLFGIAGAVVAVPVAAVTYRVGSYLHRPDP
ncbi:MAG: AI-2E family transporter, partial [Pseudonocardia sp.]|nr:AI-2E family transporter [Pseudonocardia sp.]